MLAAVAVIFVGGYMQSRNEQPLKSQVPAPAKALWKPEAGQLLTNTQLDLSERQSEQISRIAHAWQLEKAKLEEAMSASQPRQGRQDQITASLSDYSSLSRSYNAARERYWAEALAVLRPDQRRIAGGVR